MDITKRDSKMLKGVAILSMLMLHLFCRIDDLPYTPLLRLAGGGYSVDLLLRSVRGHLRADILLCERLCALPASL